MPTNARDGPATSLFASLPLKGNEALTELANVGLSDEMSAALEHAPSGECVAWGIPFEIGDVVALAERVVSVELNPTVAQWLVFMHTYLNCGYLVAAVGGTDKMSANTAVGTVRTYARIRPDREFSYETWMEAVKRAETFVTYGPLLEFAVNGYPMGSQIRIAASGGTVDVTWQVASVTTPMSRVELVVNGEIRESAAVSPTRGSGHWSARVDKSAWLALLVRGHYADQPEIVAAHSSPAMITVEGSPLLAAADAVTILEQIEGALAHLDTVGTRAEDVAYKRMRLVLQSTHRSLHNRMHQLGHYHGHTAAADHPAHH